ncbi:hypothetical protein OYC29_25375, partial [Escherichia coli]|nr:hypothetical protein [Escherichia coli]
MELVQQLLVGEGHRVGLRDARDQPALVALVVQQRLLLDVRVRGELAALLRVAHGDAQGGLVGDRRRTVQG